MNVPWLWEEQDIQELIQSSAQESLTREYKRCDALQKTEGKKKEISKDISAFANSAGGEIIYGVEEDKHVPTALDVGFDPHDISKEWLEQVINSTIQRRIDGIRIKEIALTRAKSGKVIYAVSIPQSQSAPHMAADHRYYKRYNFESIPMEDYEVRDVSRRLSTPDLFIEFCQDGALRPDSKQEGQLISKIRPIVGNYSTAPASFAILRYSVDLRIRPNPAQQSDNTIETRSEQIKVFTNTVDWRGQLRLPIFQSSRFSLNPFPISIPRAGGPFYVFWETHAPTMTRKAGAASVGIGEDNQLTIQQETIDWFYEKDIVHIVS